MPDPELDDLSSSDNILMVTALQAMVASLTTIKVRLNSILAELETQTAILEQIRDA